MEAGLDAGGEHITPFSKFVDRTKVSTAWKAHPASPSTVTNIAVLPIGQTKKNIKSFLRERLFAPNHDVRSVLYKSLAKKIPCSKSSFSQQMYTDFITESCPDSTAYADLPLPSFVDSDEEIPSYWLNEQGMLELRRLLLCINHNFAYITYCPVLPPAVALFLHYDDSPSQVFAHVCHILFCSMRQAHYTDQTKEEVEASTCVLKELIHRFAPSSHKTLVNLSRNPDDIYSQWLKVLFHGLPFSYLVIVFDMYLLEGHKALFRIAIAILKFYRKVGLSNPSDILSAVFEFVRGIDTKVSPNVLFKKAYTLKLPTTKEIKKLHHKQLSLVKRQAIVGNREGNVHERQAWTYINMVRNAGSEIVNETMFCTLYCWIPQRYSLSKPSLLFSTNKDGYSLDAFFRAAQDRIPSILLIQTTEGSIIGAFLTSDWSERKNQSSGYFGTGETFLFSLLPVQAMYPWVGIKEGQPPQGDPKAAGSGNSSAASSMSMLPKALSSAKPMASPKTSRGVVLPPIRSDALSPSVHSPSRDNPDSTISLPPLIGSPITLGSHRSPSSSSIAESTVSERIQGKSSTPRAKCSKDLFMFSDDNGLIVGGGNGYGLYVDSTFLHCSSERCGTFNNEPLVPQKHRSSLRVELPDNGSSQSQTFQCSLVELFGFSDFA